MNIAIPLLATALLTASSAAAADPSAGYGKRPDGFTLGPRLSLVSLPTPSIGVEAKMANLVGASLDYDYLPRLSLQDVKLQLTGWRAGVKVYPFRGRFFLGAAYGSRTFTASKAVTTEGVAESGKLKVTSTYLAPELGWRFVCPSGFFMGLDLGWQFVVHSSARIDTSTGLPADDRKDLEDAGKRIGKAGLPELGLLQVGWFL